MTYRNGYLGWTGGGGGAITWEAVTGKPSTFPPSAHVHIIGDVTGLQTALDGKQVAGSYAAASHNHVIADVTGLQAALDNKAALAHVHTIANVTGLQTALDGKQASGSYAATSHSHIITDVTGLQTALDAKQVTLVSGTSIKTINGVSVLGSGNLVVSGGGSDPWTYIKLASDFTISTTAAGDITGLAFTPAANTQYEFEACLMLRTALAATGPRPGLAWATGGTDGVARIDTPSSATASTIVQGNISASLLAAVGGLPNTTGSFPAYIAGTFRAGASPSGNIRLQLASETAGSVVTARAGSFLKYRII